MNRNGYRDEKLCCYFHPKQVVVGVCPLCLNERLLLLAAKQGRRHHQNHRSCSSSSSSKKVVTNPHKLQNSVQSKPPNSSSIHKIFAFGSLFTRLESRHCKSHGNYDYDDVSPSPEEDSFISIKFEENGVASWEKSTVSKVSLENCNNNSSNSWNHQSMNNMKDKLETKSVIEHSKSRDIFRWRKRIGHMFQLIRWKKTGGSVCHVGNKVDGGSTVKVRKGWMRTLTKRKKKNKTME